MAPAVFFTCAVLALRFPASYMNPTTLFSTFFSHDMSNLSSSCFDHLDLIPKSIFRTFLTGLIVAIGETIIQIIRLFIEPDPNKFSAMRNWFTLVQNIFGVGALFETAVFFGSIFLFSIHSFLCLVISAYQFIQRVNNVALIRYVKVHSVCVMFFSLYIFSPFSNDQTLLYLSTLAAIAVNFIFMAFYFATTGWSFFHVFVFSFTCSFYRVR